MKRILSIFLTLAILFSLSACEPIHRINGVPEAEEVDRIVMVARGVLREGDIVKAKTFTSKYEISRMMSALDEARIWPDERETVYGGERAVIRLYHGETLLLSMTFNYDFSFYEKNGKVYAMANTLETPLFIYYTSGEPEFDLPLD